MRHGKLSRLAEERIPLDLLHPEKTFEVHLADVMSFGGNSGSPVFLRLGGLRESTAGPGLVGFSYYLLGTMQGFFPEGTEVTIDVAHLHGTMPQNSGIAAVIPADKILHVLDSPRGKAYKERSVADFYSDQGDFKNAEILYTESIGILEKFDSSHSDLAATFEAFARFLRKAKRNVEATKAEERAKDIRKQAASSLSPQSQH